MDIRGEPEVVLKDKWFWIISGCLLLVMALIVIAVITTDGQLFRPINPEGCDCSKEVEYQPWMPPGLKFQFSNACICNTPEQESPAE